MHTQTHNETRTRQCPCPMGHGLACLPACLPRRSRHGSTENSGASAPHLLSQRSWSSSLALADACVVTVAPRNPRRPNKRVPVPGSPSWRYLHAVSDRHYWWPGGLAVGQRADPAGRCACACACAHGRTDAACDSVPPVKPVMRLD
jgi:hypothetical protein